MFTVITSLIRTRQWTEDFFGPLHSRCEKVETARTECEGAEMTAALARLDRQGFAITGCAPNLTGPGLIVMAQKVDPHG